MNYSFTVSKTGEGFATESTIMANPTEPTIDYAITDAWAQAQVEGFDLSRMPTDGDPFTQSVN